MIQTSIMAWWVISIFRFSSRDLLQKNLLNINFVKRFHEQRFSLIRTFLEWHNVILKTIVKLVTDTYNMPPITIYLVYYVPKYCNYSWHVSSTSLYDFRWCRSCLKGLSWFVLLNNNNSLFSIFPVWVVNQLAFSIRAPATRSTENFRAADRVLHWS